jgi:hypothetical protein
LLAEVRSGSNSDDNSDEQLLPIRASCAESEGTTAFISSRASSGRVRSSIRPPNLWQSTDFSSAPARVFFPGEKPSLLYLGFLCVLRFPVRAGPPSLSPHLPRGGAPPHSISPPRRCPLTSPRRCRLGCASCVPCAPPPARGPGGARPRGGGRPNLIHPLRPAPPRACPARPQPVAPAALGPAVVAGPTSSSPCAGPSSSPPLSLPLMGGRR